MAPVTTTATIHSLRPKLIKPEAGSETRLVQTSVAMVLGLNAALFLQQLNFRLRTPSHVVDGVAWYEASYASLQVVDFPFWSTKTIARTCRRLEKRGIITAKPMSRNTYDRTKWYTINDERLQEALGSTPRRCIWCGSPAGEAITTRTTAHASASGLRERAPVSQISHTPKIAIESCGEPRQSVALIGHQRHNKT